MLNFYAKLKIMLYFIAGNWYFTKVMRCPYCNSIDSQVKDSRPDTEIAIIRRRRVCGDCGAKFTTVEHVQMRDLSVLKNNGDVEVFDRDKLKRSIKLACRKRDITEEQIEKMLTSIYRRLEAETNDDNAIKSEVIGNMVSDSLLNLDPVAFIRFASVYNKFSKISDFSDFINKVNEISEKETKSKTSLF